MYRRDIVGFKHCVHCKGLKFSHTNHFIDFIMRADGPFCAVFQKHRKLVSLRPKRILDVPFDRSVFDGDPGHLKGMRH